MFYRVKNVIPVEPLKLIVQFACGITKEYDLTPTIEKYNAFKALANTPGLFDLVQVDAGGYGVFWNDDLDLSCNELWNHGTQIVTPFDGMMAFSDATTLWKLNESTLRKAISYGKLKNGIDVKKFGKQWIITEAAMIREYGEPKKT